MIMSVPRLILILVALVAIPGTQILLAYRIRHTNTFPSSLAWLTGLTLLTTVIWIMVTIFIVYVCIDCFIGLNELPLEEVLFRNTLEVPLSSDKFLCGIFPELSRQLGTNVCSLINFLLLPASLFAAGLLAFVMAKPRPKLSA